MQHFPDCSRNNAMLIFKAHGINPVNQESNTLNVMLVFKSSWVLLAKHQKDHLAKCVLLDMVFEPQSDLELFSAKILI
jgi:hypothetical protein